MSDSSTKKVLILATDYQGTTDELTSKSAEQMLIWKKKVEETFNVEIVWVIISGGASCDEIKDFNNYLLRNNTVNDPNPCFVKIEYLQSGGFVNATLHPTIDVPKNDDWDKAVCLKNVVGFYKDLYPAGIFSILYAGDERSDEGCFAYLHQIKKGSYPATPKSIVPKIFLSRLSQYFPIQTDQENIEGVISGLNNWFLVERRVFEKQQANT